MKDPGMKNHITLKEKWIDTVLGPMIAMADDTSLYLLEFASKKGLSQGIERLKQQCISITPGITPPLISIESELKAYFAGTLLQFKTAYRMFGSQFQLKVWQSLCQISYGETRSYKEQSISLGNPNGYRAVANANGANQLAIIIPCHRVIASDGTLGGYSSGLKIKQWLLEHERLGIACYGN